MPDDSFDFPTAFIVSSMMINPSNFCSFVVLFSLSLSGWGIQKTRVILTERQGESGKARGGGQAVLCMWSEERRWDASAKQPMREKGEKIGEKRRNTSCRLLLGVPFLFNSHTLFLQQIIDLLFCFLLLFTSFSRSISSFPILFHYSLKERHYSLMKSLNLLHLFSHFNFIF